MVERVKTHSEDDSPTVKEQKYIQEAISRFLFIWLCNWHNNTHSYFSNCGKQANPTEKTLQRVKHFLDYMWTHPDAEIRFWASDMVLNIHSDALYLSAPKARSRGGGYLFLGSVSQGNESIILNGAFYVLCTILNLVAASAEQKQSLESCLWMQNKSKYSKSHLRNLDTHNYRRQCMWWSHWLVENIPRQPYLFT